MGMGYKKNLLIFIFIATILFGVSIVTAGDKEDNSDNQQFSKTKNGLRFNVPEDWPIVKRGGAVAPIPTEEYLSLRFRKLDSRFDAIEQKLANFELVLQELQKIQKEILESKQQEPKEPEK